MRQSDPKYFLKLVEFVALFLFSSSAYSNVLLIINDTSPDSIAIGGYYAAKRNITHICHIRTADVETISRDKFNSEILRPVSEYLRTNSLQDEILYIVTTRGIPLIVDGDRGPVGDLASVDSELTMVYRYLVTGSFPYQGRIENPYFSLAADHERFSRKGFDIYLVTRLASFELVERALSPETGGDFYFDLSSPRQTMESEWVQQAATELTHAGFKATVENTAKVWDNLVSVQGYVSQGVNNPVSIQWRSGAIATVLDRDSGLSAGGAAGFGGYVADPMPDGYFRPQILFTSYVAGFNLAESFYASTRYLSWRQVVLGDPLLAPYAKAPEAAQPVSMDKETGLPEFFSQRRRDFLMQKYSTSKEAVLLLLKAEAAEAKRNWAEAMELAGNSLALDPLLTEATLLKSRLTPEQPKPVERAAVPIQAPISQPSPLPSETVSVEIPVRLVSKTPIRYPDAARIAGVQGVVLINLLIDEMGQVMKAEVAQGDRRLAKAVLQSIKYWRFEPMLENGRAIISRLTVPVTFRITNKP